MVNPRYALRGLGGAVPAGISVGSALDFAAPEGFVAVLVIRESKNLRELR